MFCWSWTAEMTDMTCSIDVMPCCFSSSDRMIVTGTAVSASMRLMAEPVISMRWESCAKAMLGARAPAASAASTAMWTWVFFMVVLSSRGSGC